MCKGFTTFVEDAITFEYLKYSSNISKCYFCIFNKVLIISNINKIFSW